MEAIVQQVERRRDGGGKGAVLPRAGKRVPSPPKRSFGGITVSSDAHETLFQAVPKLIVAEADEAVWQVMRLPEWLHLFVLRDRNGAGHLTRHDGTQEDGETVALAVPPTDCLGVVALSEKGKAALAAYARWVGEKADLPAPEVTSLTGRAADEWQVALLDFLVSRLWAERVSELGRNAALRRALCELRESHEAAQSVLVMLSDAMARHQIPAIHCALALHPGTMTVGPEADGARGATVRQRLPVHSQGLAAIALHVTMGGRRPKGSLLVRLSALESKTNLISWSIPYDRLSSGWNLLEIPTVVAGPRQTVEVVVRWDGDPRGAPQLSLSGQPGGTDTLPEVEGRGRLRHPLAMQIWVALPGSRRVVSAFADPMDLRRAAEAGRHLMLSPAALAQARLLSPLENVGFDVLSVKDDGRVLQLHPVAGRVAHAVIPHAAPAGTKRLTATVKTDNPEGPWVEYAMMLAPAGTEASFPTVDRPGSGAVVAGEWQALPASTMGSLVLHLPEPTTEICDIHIATRTPPGVADAFAWAQWKTFAIELA